MDVIAFPRRVYVNFFLIKRGTICLGSQLENLGNVDSIHKRENTAEKCRENGQTRSLKNYAGSRKPSANRILIVLTARLLKVSLEAAHLILSVLDP